ncbi:response regulator [Desulfurispira natronophila]|uniref:YesN/AraC family two-component response regulator n=1 Tax=Desulfurispira natronophila TaxID=682562 RepID=A0A7W8DGJ8_9BACT|nr:response regulator [Desulfurispira natronophila]MBB5021333.1 YesN/AraC family two-component response regulator [Desulfurispira natronophila]
MDTGQLLKKKTVLVVEDDHITLHYLSRLIGFRTSKVYQAINGQDGLDKCAQHQPDIVVTDLEMPVMSGMRMLDIMKDQTPERPVIVVTAFNDENHLVPRADAMLVKPINKNDLIRILQDAALQTEKS